MGERDERKELQKYSISQHKKCEQNSLSAANTVLGVSAAPRSMMESFPSTRSPAGAHDLTSVLFILKKFW